MTGKGKPNLGQKERLSKLHFRLCMSENTGQLGGKVLPETKAKMPNLV